MDIKNHIVNRNIDLNNIVSLSLDKNYFHLDNVLPSSNSDIFEYYTHLDYDIDSSEAYCSVSAARKSMVYYLILIFEKLK